MPYEYDAFVSYPHDEPVGTWVRNIFVPLLRPYLRNALGRPENLFLDEDTIAPGAAWPQRIRRALACSRCLIPVLSIEYFYSEWCLRECAVMLLREQRFGYRTTQTPDGLICPVLVF